MTSEMIARARIVAQGQQIHDLERLLRQYGGVPSRWFKKSSPPFEVDDVLFEIHWYEHHGLGKFELKQKKVG